MIEFKNVSFSYGKSKRILSDFSLTVDDGERIAFSGASGCGKTTILKLTEGLLRPTKGSVVTDGKIRTVFQEDRLLPFRTVIDNLTLFAEKERSLEILGRLGVADTADKYPSSLSGGMARRVSIARALSADADIYIFDEPFNGLDGENKQSAIELINEITKGRTVLLVTHDAEEIASLGCRTVAVKKA